MRDRSDSTRPTSGNAFDRAFLDLLDSEDDPLTATEAAAEGPWTIVQTGAGSDRHTETDGRKSWAVIREADPPGSVQPAATLTGRHAALLAAAAVPIAARDPTYRLARDADRCGFAVYCGERVVGHLPWYHRELVDVLNHLDALTRSPRALATVLEAAGATALARSGALLARSSRR